MGNEQAQQDAANGTVGGTRPAATEGSPLSTPPPEIQDDLESSAEQQRQMFASLGKYFVDSKEYFKDINLRLLQQEAEISRLRGQLIESGLA